MLASTVRIRSSFQLFFTAPKVSLPLTPLSLPFPQLIPFDDTRSSLFHFRPEFNHNHEPSKPATLSSAPEELQSDSDFDADESKEFDVAGAQQGSSCPQKLPSS